METMNDKVTHGLIDTTELQKKWLDELDAETTKYRQNSDGWQRGNLMEASKSSSTTTGKCLYEVILAECFDRLISMARQGINYKTIEMVDGWTIEDLVAKVRLYENVLREIANQVGKRASDLAWVATEALDKDK